MAPLPLFPLGTVLVPGAQLPLQLFEPRYLVMLADLVNGPGEPRFGVVAIRHGVEVGAEAVHDLYDIGCVAHVTAAAEVEEGRYFVIADGLHRFRLDAVVADAGTPYLVGEVTELEDPPGGTEPELQALATRVREALTAHARGLGVASPSWPDDPGDVSNAVGTALGLELGERQQLLAAPDIATRLRMGLELVRRERRLASTLSVVAPAPDLRWNPN